MLFNLDAGGFRLKKMELYNWGTFSDRVWEIDPNCETSLLTGANGSGKTTMVDAITSLLVPPNVRHYNQSSGSEKKRERTEQSYTLGAYGNITDDLSTRIKTQTLRDNDTVSILTGVFYDKVTKGFVTLGQIRYFTASSFNRVFFISTKELSLKENVLPFDNRGEYKRRLTKLNTRFYDNFKAYASTFGKLFGFKSSKALNLFSQTVGVKVLGDINEFIRKQMLEEGSAYSKFEAVYDSFQHLIDTQLLIERAEKELELLKRVGLSGEKYKNIEHDLEVASSLVFYYPYFEAEEKLNNLISEKLEKEAELEDSKSDLIKIKDDLDLMNRSIRESERAIDSNEVAEKLRSIEKDILYCKRDITEKKRLWSQYEYFSKVVGRKVPASSHDFLDEKLFIDSNRELLTIEQKSLSENLFDIKRELMEKKQSKNSLKDEFDSLLNRDNNIPLRNIAIRDSITSALKMDRDLLPFVGECIRVKESESMWEIAIERLLHSFALCILVDKKDYQRVNNYINNNNLKGRVVFFKVDTTQEYIYKGTINKGSVPEKLDIKSDSPFKDWLEERIISRFNYICTEDMDEFKRLDYGVTKTGLIKNKNRHEKDDRTSNHSILGWDNLKKRALLERSIKALCKNIDDSEKELKGVQIEEEEILNKLNALQSMTMFKFADINFLDLEKELYKLNKEYKHLFEASDELNTLQKTLDKLKEKILETRSKESNILKKVGFLEHRIDELETHINREDVTLKGFETKNNNILELLKGEFSNLYNNDIDKLPQFKDRLYTEVQNTQKKKEVLAKTLITTMGNFIKPDKVILEKYPSWMDDTRDLKPDVEYLPDFNELYKRVLKNDLPNYKKSFRQFLNKRVLEDMVGLNHALENELKEIEESIRELNLSLKSIRYQDNPATYICLKSEITKDRLIRDFRSELKDTFADALKLAKGEFSEMELFFTKSKTLLNSLKSDENRRKKVLDTRNWLNFTAEERFIEDKALKQVYRNSESLSGGEKAKLAYTILASAIVFQFGIQESKGSCFRFVVVDEAFSKADIKNSKYLMDLFSKLDLQLIVITPLDSINVVEEYIHAIHFVQKGVDNRTVVINMSIDEYREDREEFKNANT